MATEDEMVGWNHRLNGHKFEHTPRDSERWGSLACSGSWGPNLATEQQQRKLFTNIMAFLTTLSMWVIHMGQLFTGSIDTLIRFCGNNFFPAHLK